MRYLYLDGRIEGGLTHIFDRIATRIGGCLDGAACRLHSNERGGRGLLRPGVGLRRYVGALIRAKERGVDVRLLADREAPCGRASGIEPLKAAGVPVWIDYRARIAHAKTVAVDAAVTLQGSYNWTRGAAANSEDLNLINSPPVAGAYSAHWRQRLAVSAPFVDREDWCRSSSGRTADATRE
jgi:phosphatidylserine/phosphatidylglycerophosphate/cardiolipin synthase-like enzyme